MTSLEKAVKIAKILNDKKADEVTVLSVAASSSVWEYYVIASGTSNTHIKALSNEIDDKMKDFERPLHVEGYVSAEWILMDYNDVNVHIFQKDSRMFYSLEKLYQTSEKIDWSAM